jgi:hypothetical protein
MEEQLKFWAASIFPPTLALGMNLIIRGKEVLKSCGADWLLLIFAVDLTGCYAPEELAKHISNLTLRGLALQVALSTAFLSLGAWLIIVNYLEPYIRRKANGSISIKAVGSAVVTWIVVIILTAGHVWIFLQKGEKI